MMQDLEPLEDISDDIVESILKTKYQSKEKTIDEEQLEDIITCCLEWLDDFVRSNMKLFHYKDYEEHWRSFLEDIYEDNYYELLGENDDIIQTIIDQTIERYYCIIPLRSRETSTILYVPNKSHITNTLNHLKSLNEKLPAQRTTEWYDFRHNLLSASSLWKVFDTDAIQNQLIFEKCQPIQTDKYSHVNINSPLHWGQKYEPLSIMYYEYTYDTKISEYGCIPHDTYSFIGASPDGINTKKDNDRYGRMLEIKNVVSRVIDGIPKKEYWIQMQLQMECCNLDECDFLECKFDTYNNAEEFYNDNIEDDICNTSSDGCYKGMIMVFFDNGRPVYEYMPIQIQSKTDINIWMNKTMKTNEQYTWVQNDYWKLSTVSCVLVERNKEWFQSIVPEIKSFWDTIIYEREHGYDHRKPNKRQKKENNQDSTTYTSITNSKIKKQPSNALVIELDI